MKLSKVLLQVLSLSLFLFTQLITATSLEEILTITPKEKIALDKFRGLVLPYLSTDYMKQDIYLIRWLRPRHFNAERAKDMLLENLRWRKKNKMDSILQEDWSDMKENYVYEYGNALDKEGRPIVTIHPWNLRNAAISGQMPRLIRYTSGLLEEMKEALAQAQKEGKNVTTVKIIFNMDGFNVVEHACPLCLPFYTSFAHTYQSYYPSITDALVFINTPPAFKAVLDVIRPILTARSRTFLKVYGQDKKEWMAYLDKEIDRSQRRPEFGGTKT